MIIVHDALRCRNDAGHNVNPEILRNRFKILSFSSNCQQLNAILVEKVRPERCEKGLKELKL